MASTQSTPTPTLLKHEQPEINDDANSRRKRTTTAERRATHNAVERARRETLNGRFLLLASLLPNLSQIRRPSKSAIVNSSVAHVNASRRHRLLAARVTQELLREAEDLRREVNEWRDRAGVRKLEPRMRAEGVGMVLRGELEPIAITNDEDDEDDYGFHDQTPRSAAPYPSTRPHLMQRHAPYPPPMVHPMVVSPSSAGYDMGYAPSHQTIASAPAHATLPSPPSAPPVHSPIPSHHANGFAHPAEAYPVHDEKAYHMYAATQHMQIPVVGPHAQWSDDSSSTSSNGSGYANNHAGSPPSSPSSFEPNSSGSRASFEFGSYEFDTAYDLVPPGSSGSEGGYMGSVPRGLAGHSMLSSSPAHLNAEHYGMMPVA